MLGLAAYLLLRGLESRAASVSRVSLVFFLVFYTAYEVTVGVGTGVLVDYANGLPPAEQAVVADAIQDYNESYILGDPVSVSLAPRPVRLGGRDARRRGRFPARRCRLADDLLVGFSALFAIHPPPIGPIGLALLRYGGPPDRAQADGAGRHGSSHRP